ncbi:thioesterase family protein [Lutibacter sp. TH_r2]|uniref:acyl-CoA thioesterase n=1 Tax=Lutibacter sp. TH_r2 TaxID=3082083 RepID=UPI002955CA10|nr:thioesterase family protein [Lutibacter sp. TH_r2]MDV7187585.1 thioesterase family protein [Lutibacter sp. TH_r2]
MSIKPYSFTVKVKKEHIDVLNHVNNVQYLNWVQDAALKHWATLTTEKIDANYFWVVARHEIDYISSALLNEELTVKTWIGLSKGKISERFVNIYRGEDLIVKVKTIWCLMSKKTFRSSIIPEEVYAILE